MNHLKNIRKHFSDIFRVSLIIILFILFSVLIPTYDTVNGFYNIFFSNFQLVWHDGRSALNFLLIKNILSAGFGNVSLGNITQPNLDVKTVGNKTLPVFNAMPTYVYAAVLYPFREKLTNDISLFRSIVFLNIVVYALSLVVFYFLSKKLGLSKNNAFFATLTLGFATSFVIYTHYLFFIEPLLTLAVLILIYLASSNVKSNLLYGLLIAVISALITLSSLYIGIGIAVVFSLILLFTKFATKRALIVALIFTLIFSFIYQNYGLSLFTFGSGPHITLENFIRFGPTFIPAKNFEVYGFYNVTLGTFLPRAYAYVYGFTQQPGNAVFLSFYGLFASLFSERGFVYNSSFLIFSIIGLFLYQKNRRIRNLLLFILILFIISVGLLDSIWYGGFTPRYVRSFGIPIAILTFFSFYYIQKLWLQKTSRLKKFLTTTIFVILIALSTLNAISLSIRTDWNYEQVDNLVSYDLILWPWITPASVNLLTTTGQTTWTLSGESYCKAVFNNGIITDPCDCRFNSFAVRPVYSTQQKIKLDVVTCAGEAGGDGTVGYITFDSETQPVYTASNSCNNTVLVFNESLSTLHTLILQSGIYGKCSGEATIWKEISVVN